MQLPRSPADKKLGVVLGRLLARAFLSYCSLIVTPTRAVAETLELISPESVTDDSNNLGTM
jgi:hypothetical protein